MGAIVALIGRPNVGKSTLFNRLTGRRDALVADLPGLTRDRLFGGGEFDGRRFSVVDTGGITDTPEALSEAISEQAWQAAREADAVLFMVDGRSGLNAADSDIALRLRREGLLLYVVVNKIEGQPPQQAVADFHALGLGEPYAISAERGDGVERLLQQVMDALPVADEAADGPQDDPRTRVTIIGRPNAGKSTLVNRLAGAERVLANRVAGTTRDAVQVPLSYRGGEYLFIDTAGIRRRSRINELPEKLSVVKALRGIEQAQVVIVMLDLLEGIAEQDMRLLGHALERGRAAVIALNKSESFDETARRSVRSETDRLAAFAPWIERVFISALEGRGLAGLMKAVDRAHASAGREVSTADTNRVLEAAVRANPPPLVRGRRIKLRYAHPGGLFPPTFVVHGNQVSSLPDSYRRFLANRFREIFGLVGTPVRIELRQGDNPYAGRGSNPLSPGQERHRHRQRRRLRKQYG